MLPTRFAISMAPINKFILCPQCQHRAGLIKHSDGRFIFACQNIARKAGAGESGFICQWQSRIMTLLEAEAYVMEGENAESDRKAELD